MPETFNEYIDNKISIDGLDKFAVIIGINPSKTARSPLLWNSAFKANNLNYSMIPIDVGKDNLINVLRLLIENNNFIGGSVTTPYKTDIAKWLEKNISKEANNIGAINCIYRNQDGILKGTNTDGEASVIAFKNIYSEFNNKNVAVLGCGGAGKAVATYFSKELDNGNLYLTSRNKNHSSFVSKLKNTSWIDWYEKKKILNEIDILINCTSMGFDKQINVSPLSSDDFANLKKQAIVYDIIYNPTQTLLLKLAEKNGFKTINGSEMNLLQAVLAFKYAIKNKENNKNAEKAMREVVKK